MMKPRAIKVIKGLEKRLKKLRVQSGEEKAQREFSLIYTNM